MVMWRNDTSNSIVSPFPPPDCAVGVSPSHLPFPTFTLPLSLAYIFAGGSLCFSKPVDSCSFPFCPHRTRGSGLKAIQDLSVRPPEKNLWAGRNCHPCPFPLRKEKAFSSIHCIYPPPFPFLPPPTEGPPPRPPFSAMKDCSLSLLISYKRYHRRPLPLAGSI